MNYLLNLVLGIALGYAGFYIARYSLGKRTEPGYKSFWISKKFSWVIWSVITALVFVAVTAIQTKWGWLEFGRFMLIFEICLAIGVVDHLIKKIPNEMILIMLVTGIVYLAINHNFAQVLNALIGLAVGLVLFIIPSYFGFDIIGGGDIKFAAAAGLVLGTYGVFQAVFIMGIGMLILAGYLLVTKKGNLKTFAPMGPFLSIGIILTMILPIIKF